MAGSERQVAGGRWQVAAENLQLAICNTPLTALIVGAALLLSAATAYWLTPRQPAVVLALLAGGVAGVAFLRYPAFGILTLIAASLLIPGGIGTNTQTEINISVLLPPLLLALWFFDVVANRRRLSANAASSLLSLPRPLLPLIALVVVAFIAFIVGQLPWVPFATHAPLPAQLGGLATFLVSAGTFLLAAFRIQQARWLAWATWLFVILASSHVLSRLLPGLDFITALVPLGATGSVFWIWLVAIPLSQALFNQRLAWRWRVALLGVVAATLYVSLFTNQTWASGWLPALVTAVVVLFLWKPGLALLLALVSGLALFVDSGATIEAFVRSQSYSLTTRLAAWQIIGEIIRANPVTGLGPSNYYWYTPLYPILGWYVRFNSHNQYIDLIAQVGIAGLFCFLWFSAEMARLSWRLRTRLSPGFGRAYTYGVIGGLAGMLAAGMLGDWIIPFVYNIGLAGLRASLLGWLFLGGVVALSLNSS